MTEEHKLDPVSPFYLGSGDQLGNQITHVILKGDNCLAWARAITLSLKARQKFVFIDGTIKKPTEKFVFIDDLYSTVRSNLLSQQSPPDLTRAYQAFLPEERVRGIACDKTSTADASIFAIKAFLGISSMYSL